MSSDSADRVTTPYTRWSPPLLLASAAPRRTLMTSQPLKPTTRCRSMLVGCPVKLVLHPNFYIDPSPVTLTSNPRLAVVTSRTRTRAKETYRRTRWIALPFLLTWSVTRPWLLFSAGRTHLPHVLRPQCSNSITSMCC